MRRRRSTLWAVTALVAAGPAMGIAGCGANTSYANRARPASPVMVSGAIDDQRVRLSPTAVGAGPVDVIVANLTATEQRLTFETDGRSGGIRSSTSVAASDTTTMQVTPRRGGYRLSVRDRGVQPARLTVGAPRPSAQDELLQP